MDKKRISTMSTDEEYVDAVAVAAVATDIVVAATEINTNVDSDSSDEVQVCTIRRLSWPKMNLTIRKNGKSVETHPFLDDGINERDRALVRILLDERPYNAGHGEVGATWAVILQKCNELQDETGQKLFIPELQEVTTVQSRMKNYLTFIKKHQKNVPLRSGCDDEKPSNLLGLLHQLSEDYGSGVQESMLRRDQRRKHAAKREAGRAAAVMLKDRSVKKLELRAAFQGDGTEGISSSDVESRQPKKTKSGGSNTHNSIQAIADLGKARSEAKIAAMERKDKAEVSMNNYLQWRMNEAALDREQAALNREQAALDRALLVDEMKLRQSEAENRKMELKLLLKRDKIE
jgi:hypothetical protein